MKKIQHIIVSLFRYVFLIAFSYVLLYPLLYIIVHAIQDPVDYFDPTVQWIPKNFTLENFKLGIEVLDFWSGLIQTLLVQIISALVQVASCGIAAYGMARFQFKGKKLVTGLLMLNILVPSTMIIIPSYLNFRNVDILGILTLIGNITGRELTINLLNTPYVFYLPAIFGVGLQSGLVIYIFQQFFKSFPKELEEAAYLDGLNPFGTFFRIVVPSSSVVIITTTILSIIWHWNEYYLPSMYLSKNYPLAVKIHDIFNMFYAAGYDKYDATTINACMAVCLLFLLPPLVMYLFLQKKFMKSIARSGIVG